MARDLAKPRSGPLAPHDGRPFGFTKQVVPAELCLNSPLSRREGVEGEGHSKMGWVVLTIGPQVSIGRLEQSPVTGTAALSYMHRERLWEFLTV